MADQRKCLSMKSSKLDKAIELYLLNWPQFQSVMDAVRERGKAEFSSRVFHFFAPITSVLPKEMADQRKWLSIKSSELDKAIELYLLNWPQFQSAVDVVRERGKAEFSSRVFDFFATSTSVPTVDGLAENLFRAMSSLQASIALNFCKEGAEHLLHAYNAYLAAGGLYNPAEISRESLLGFKQSMDSALAEWPGFETVSHMLGVQRGDTVATAMFFFFAKPDPTVDGLADEMHRAISADLDGLIDFSDIKKAAQEFLDALLSCYKYKVLNKPVNLKRQQSLTRCDTAEVKKAKY